MDIEEDIDQPELFADNDRLYIAAAGFQTVDVTDSDQPILLSGIDEAFAAFGIAPNGSGLAVLAAGAAGVAVYDVSAPQDTANRADEIGLGVSIGQVALARGLAYALGDSFHVVNYLPFVVSGAKRLEPPGPYVTGLTRAKSPERQHFFASDSLHPQLREPRRVADYVDHFEGLVSVDENASDFAPTGS